jgi:CP12 domain
MWVTLVTLPGRLLFSETGLAQGAEFYGLFLSIGRIASAEQPFRPLLAMPGVGVFSSGGCSDAVQATPPGSSGLPLVPPLLPSTHWTLRSKLALCFTQNMKTMIKDAIKEAEEACEDTGKTNECAAAWDEVEELSAADSHKKEGVRTCSYRISIRRLSITWQMHIVQHSTHSSQS